MKRNSQEDLMSADFGSVDIALQQIIDCDPVATFVIDQNHQVTHWNKACAALTGRAAAALLGTSLQWQAFYPAPRPTLADLIVAGSIEEHVDQYYGTKGARRSTIVAEAFEAEDFFPYCGEAGRWLYFTAAPLYNTQGELVGAIETLQDISERKWAEAALLETQEKLETLVEQRTEQLANAKKLLEADVARRKNTERELLRRNEELSELNSMLSQAKQQLVQNEKLASLGQLAAGVAHEINNPIGYVQSNINALENYLNDLFGLLDLYQQVVVLTPDAVPVAASVRSGVIDELARMRDKIDLKFLRDDIPHLLNESKEGIQCVRKIVQGLKDFSRAEIVEGWQKSDVHTGLDASLKIANKDIKYRAEIVRRYGELPLVECMPAQLNQVFMNLLLNAVQAIPADKSGEIVIETGREGDSVWVAVSDNGIGIAPNDLGRIFDPFFTTKSVGKGTGLGLSLAYGIVQKHHGEISVNSEVGKGTCFRVLIPIRQSAAPGSDGVAMWQAAS